MAESKSEVISAADAAGRVVRSLVDAPHPTVLGPDVAERLLGAGAALAEARRVLADAERLASEARAEAYRDGLAEGLAEAHRVAARARSERSSRLADSETDVVNLALAVARRALGCALSLDPDLVAQLFAEALSKVNGSHRIELRVNQADLEAATGASAQLEAAAGQPITVMADPRVPRAACRIDTEEGVLEASLDSQLEALRIALVGTSL